MLGVDARTAENILHKNQFKPINKTNAMTEGQDHTQKQYTILCAFLQSYKEKLLLTKKVHDVLDD
jgi:hypothetical protein